MSTIALRGFITSGLYNLERGTDEGCNTIKILCRNGRLTVGAGASEFNIQKRNKFIQKHYQVLIYMHLKDSDMH
jgi:hypothetical protein